MNPYTSPRTDSCVYGIRIASFSGICRALFARRNAPMLEVSITEQQFNEFKSELETLSGRSKATCPEVGRLAAMAKDDLEAHLKVLFQTDPDLSGVLSQAGCMVRIDVTPSKISNKLKYVLESLS